MALKKSLIDCIGGTPLVRLNNFGSRVDAQLYAKLEMFNPFSIKDRPALYMITEAENRGEIDQNTTIIEASSGNTAIALAMICSARRYRVIICMSEIQSIERRNVLRAYGAELVLTPADAGTKGARDKAIELSSSIENSLYICQHSNPDNITAHYETTGPELWEDTEGKIDVLVCGLGTTGTAIGVAKRIKPLNASFMVIGVEPAESPYLKEGIFNPHRMMGTAPGWKPDIYNPENVDEIYLVSESEAFNTCRELIREEGIIAGITSGATAFAARELARQKQFQGSHIVAMFADSGERYLSVKGLFDKVLD